MPLAAKSLIHPNSFQRWLFMGAAKIWKCRVVLRTISFIRLLTILIDCYAYYEAGTVLDLGIIIPSKTVCLKYNGGIEER